MTQRQRRDDALRRMRRAEVATYLAVGVSALAYLIVSIRASRWASALDTVIWASVMTALAYALGRRHKPWAAATLAALLVFGLIVRTIEAGRPPFVLLVAVLLYLYVGAFQAAREYAALRETPGEGDHRKLD